jgi:type IV secretory pathway VirB3-like protein
MFLFLILLGSAIALIVIGAVVDGMLYLLSTGVLLLVVAVLYLLVRSILRSRRSRSTTP